MERWGRRQVLRGGPGLWRPENYGWRTASRQVPERKLAVVER